MDATQIIQNFWGLFLYGSDFSVWGFATNIYTALDVYTGGLLIGLICGLAGLIIYLRTGSVIAVVSVAVLSTGLLVGTIFATANAIWVYIIAIAITSSIYWAIKGRY